MKVKSCSKCKVVKEVGEFHKRNDRKGGLQPKCKACNRAYEQANSERISERRRKHYQANRDRILEKQREYQRANPEKVAEKKRKYYRANPEKFAESNRKWAEANPEFHREYKRKWAEANPEKLTQYQRKYRRANRDKAREYERNRRKTNPIFRIAKVIRSRTNAAYKAQGATKDIKSSEAVGCTWEELCKHLEAQFQPGMTHENYGNYQGGWVIDHWIPLAKFDLTKPEHQRLASHYTNLQPLWWEDNSSKSATVILCSKPIQITFP